MSDFELLIPSDADLVISTDDEDFTVFPPPTGDILVLLEVGAPGATGPAGATGPTGPPGPSASAPAYREVTAAGSITITTTDEVVAVNKTVAAATSVLLPAASTRSGLVLIIKDKKGDADVNNITPVGNGGELIDGLAAATFAIVSPGDNLKLLPLAAGGWLTIT